MGNDGATQDLPLWAQASMRVIGCKRLKPYANIILADWPEGSEHWRWVIRGRVKEIEAWAKQIQEDSDG